MLVSDLLRIMLGLLSAKRISKVEMPNLEYPYEVRPSIHVDENGQVVIEDILMEDREHLYCTFDAVELDTVRYGTDGLLIVDLKDGQKIIITHES